MSIRELPPDDPEIVAGDRIQQLNKWPADRPLWRKTLPAYFDAIDGVSYDLLRAFALALDVEEDYFHRFYLKPLTQVSILHYPPQQPADKAFGNRPHADETAFTIVLQETVTGLEVRTRSGEWVSAPPVDGSFVVNIGDYMARWTNGRFRSTLHRVVNRTGNERYSILYFAISNFDAEIGLLGAVSTCPGGDRGAKHSSGQVQCHSLKIEIYKPADDALESWQSSTLNAYSRNPRPRLTEQKEEGIDTYVRLRSIRKERPVRLPTLSWHQNFGEPGVGQHGHWTLSLDNARPIFKAAMDQGLYYFDCANNYGMGASERVVGALLRELFPRESYVLSTKLIMPMAKGLNGAVSPVSMSWKRSMRSLRASASTMSTNWLSTAIPRSSRIHPPPPLKKGSKRCMT